MVTQTSAYLNNSGYSYLGIANISWQDQWNWFGLVLDVDLYHYDSVYKLKAKSNQKQACREINSQELDCDFTESSSRTDFKDGVLNYSNKLQRGVFNEAYILFKHKDIFSLKVGQFSILWGQIYYLSPVNALFPLRFTRDLSNPAHFSWPQQGIVSNILLSDKVELELMYLDRIQFDPLITLQIQEDSFLETHKQKTYAVRLLTYLSSAQFIFTYHKGIHSIQTQDRDSFVIEKDSEGIDQIFLYDYDYNKLLRVESWIFEIVVPFGKWEWKLELLYQLLPHNFANSVQKTGLPDFLTRLPGKRQNTGSNAYDLYGTDQDEELYEQIYAHFYSNAIDPNNPLPGNPSLDEFKRDISLCRVFEEGLINLNNLDRRESDLLIKILCENDGLTNYYFPTYTIGTAFTRYTSRMFLSVGLLLQFRIEDALGKKLLDLSYKILEEEDDYLFVEREYAFAPFIFMNYSLDDAKRHAIGFSMAVIPIGIGFSTYYSININERVHLSFSTELIYLLPDTLITDTALSDYIILQNTIYGLRIYFKFKI